MEEIREAFGQKLVELGGRYRNLYVIDADLNTSTRTVLFLESYPKRFVQAGIAEQNMVGMAAGLALEGKIPVVCSFADFLSKRACDQISISVAYANLNVKLAGAYPGLFTGKQGGTHQAVQDLANLRAMPNMRVLAPCECEELEQMLEAMLEYIGPVYFRIPRCTVDKITPPDYRFQWGKGVILKYGTDVTLVGTGVASQWLLEAVPEIAKAGVNAEILHLPCLKPFDVDLLCASAAKTGTVVTVENHSCIGGLGGAVAEALSENRPTPLIRLGIDDTFVESGEDDDLRNKYGLSTDCIVAAATKAAGIK
ncbi:MAG: transketolase family protein [Planctomycetes bacterium]|nr:transketolase family protein [Planctomycetota bacterium]